MEKESHSNHNNTDRLIEIKRLLLQHLTTVCVMCIYFFSEGANICLPFVFGPIVSCRMPYFIYLSGPVDDISRCFIFILIAAIQIDRRSHPIGHQKHKREVGQNDSVHCGGD